MWYNTTAAEKCPQTCMHYLSWWNKFCNIQWRLSSMISRISFQTSIHKASKSPWLFTLTSSFMYSHRQKTYTLQDVTATVIYKLFLHRKQSIEPTLFSAVGECPGLLKICKTWNLNIKQFVQYVNSMQFDKNTQNKIADGWKNKHAIITDAANWMCMILSLENL